MLSRRHLVAALLGAPVALPALAFAASRPALSVNPMTEYRAANVRDAQRALNYGASARAEAVALSPKAVWIGRKGDVFNWSATC